MVRPGCYPRHGFTWQPQKAVFGVSKTIYTSFSGTKSCMYMLGHRLCRDIGMSGCAQSINASGRPSEVG